MGMSVLMRVFQLAIIFFSFGLGHQCKAPGFSLYRSCSKGQFVVSMTWVPECRECTKGTFMPYKNHNYTDCKPCSKAEYFNNEVEIQRCTSERDTIIGCKEGFFKKIEIGGFHCKKCSNCSIHPENKFERRLCGGQRDSVCCAQSDMEVRGEECMRKPEPFVTEPSGAVLRKYGCWMGEFATAMYAGNSLAACTLCEAGTYMDEVNHYKSRCKPCSVDEFNDLVRPCSRVQDAQYSSSGDEYCGKGERLVDEAGSERCKPCPHNTFMPLTNHTYRSCKKCSKAKRYNFETQIAPCTSTHDTIILCDKGYFRFEMKDIIMHEPSCERCTNCATVHNKFEGRQCGSKSDTVCCPEPGMFVVDIDGYPECFPHQKTDEESEKANIMTVSSCKQGEYLDEDDEKLSAVCKPCPRGTFMNKTEHTLKSCWPCSSEPGLILERECSLTRDAVFTVCYCDQSEFETKCNIYIIILVILCAILIIIIICLLALSKLKNMYECMRDRYQCFFLSKSRSLNH